MPRRIAGVDLTNADIRHRRPPGRTAIECLNVLFGEEWAPHRSAVREPAVLRQTTQP